MRPSLLLFPLILATAACDLQPSEAFSDYADKKFAAMDGPEVDGMNATLERSAKEALDQGKPEAAAQFYKQLLDLPKNTDEQKYTYAIGMAEAFRRAGEVDSALKALNLVLDKDPDNLDALEGKGLALLADGKSVEAGRTLEQVMKKDATRWRTLNALGILFTTKNMIPEALAYFSEALKFSADNPSVLNNVGLSYAADRQFPKAIEALEQASRYAPSGSQRKRQIDLNTAMVLGIAGDLENARKLAAKHLKGPALDNNLGLYAHLSNNDALARAYLNTALSNSPMHYERAWKNLELMNETGKSATIPKGGKAIKVTD